MKVKGVHIMIHLHLHPLTGTVGGVPFTQSPRQRCLPLLYAAGSVSLDVSIFLCCLASFVSLVAPSSFALHDGLQDVFLQLCFV